MGYRALECFQPRMVIERKYVRVYDDDDPRGDFSISQEGGRGVEKGEGEEEGKWNEVRNII